MKEICQIARKIFQLSAGTFPNQTAFNHLSSQFLLGRAVVAVLADDSFQALALSRLLVAGAADGKVGVAAAPLAAVGAEVPEAGHAPVALLPDHAGLASALPRLEVTLGSEKANL